MIKQNSYFTNTAGYFHDIIYTLSSKNHSISIYSIIYFDDTIVQSLSYSEEFDGSSRIIDSPNIVKFDNYTFSCNFEIETNKKKKKRSRYCVNKLGTFRRMKHRLRVEKDGNDCESIRVNEIRSELHLRRL